MKLLLSTLVALILFLGYGHAGSAEELLTEEQSVQAVQEASEVQASLTEKERPLNEIKAMMKPYFTHSFIETYVKENVKETENGYIVYGSDFIPYSMPYFNYEEELTFGAEKNTYKLFQFFPAEEEGPVSYDDQYEAVLFVKENGEYKIDDVIFSETEPKTESPEKKQNLLNVSLIFNQPEGVLFGNEGGFSFVLNPYFQMKTLLSAYAYDVKSAAVNAE
ncbi:DUF3993 domain-containing protein [Metabacillus sp. cB07]|uniref:DUF3993 domain-containing protein n=1 Tax=Metabacillus sp. cB07 TaxID=2806989 RepID=UPI0019397E9B|nr:DUF3993 domain-containing protein [Metabacillus sp. cB07]